MMPDREPAPEARPRWPRHLREGAGDHRAVFREFVEALERTLAEPRPRRRHRPDRRTAPAPGREQTCPQS